MLRRCVTIWSLVALTMLTFAAQGLQAKQASTETGPGAPIAIDGLGKGTVSLSGPWQFHPGDDAAWASPAFDSSGWERISADKPWGAQGHAGLAGFAWYRCSIEVTPAPGVAPRFSLLVPQVFDAYEIYWNGKLVGRNGVLEPQPNWLYSQPPQAFDLGVAEHGVLAVRVWKSPFLSDDSREEGGFATAPLIGSRDAIATAKAALEFRWLRGHQFIFGENLLCAVIALLSLLLWSRTPSRWVLFWTASFALIPPVNLLLLNAHMALPYRVVMAAVQPLSAIRDLSLWFLLLWVLLLHEHRGIARLTRILAWVWLVAAALDGVLINIAWNPRWTRLVQNADAVSGILSIVLEAFPLLLAGYAVIHRRQLDSARWLVAILTLLDEMLVVTRNGLKESRPFGNWSIPATIDAPLFTIGGSAISLYTFAGLLLLVAIVYAVYSSVRDDQRRQDALELEKLELIRETSLMRYQAEHDGLTGLWNHRVIVEQLREEMNRAHRNGSALSVVLIDVDHFKKINDSFGHPAGDLVLQELSSIFTHALRPYDSVGRYGGEEFLLILPGCELESAMLRAEQLRSAVESALIRDGEIALQVTASFGVASALASQAEAETVIRAVDAALYRAKSIGRNCVVADRMDLPLFEGHGEV
ncbi:MAG TPA: diguanylate cyclase [Acidobacteriaceae bacterium]|nr:diguanylate cyclase [Acidobacteriaceae bacterium]